MANSSEETRRKAVCTIFVSIFFCLSMYGAGASILLYVEYVPAAATEWVALGALSLIGGFCAHLVSFAAMLVLICSRRTKWGLYGDSTRFIELIKWD